MTEKEVLSTIGIAKAGVFKDGKYTIELDNDTDWGKMFSLLEKSKLVEEVEGDSLTVNESVFYYEYNNNNESFLITLSSSFDDDTYSLEVEKEATYA